MYTQKRSKNHIYFLIFSMTTKTYFNIDLLPQIYTTLLINCRFFFAKQSFHKGQKSKYDSTIFKITHVFAIIVI